MNYLGGFDFYNFTSYSKKTSEITRKSYEFQRHRVDGLGLVYTNADNGKSDYVVKSRDKVRVKSDYLTNEQADWLKELLTSPQVYVEFVDDGDTADLKQVRVLASQWRELQVEHDKLFQLEFDIEFSHQNIRQRK